MGVMNIRCEWLNDGRLAIWSCNTLIGWVSMGEDPVLTITHTANPSLSFSEIDHIMDNWNNMPKPKIN